MKILAATDLSERSRRAVKRAALLARALGAELSLLHVVDEDQPENMVEMERRIAQEILEATVSRDRLLAAAEAEILVVAGDPFQGILDAAEALGSDLIVAGAHRKRLLRDVFIGTTVERVMRHGRHPVLMVNRDEESPYRQVLAAVDFSENAARALKFGKALSVLEDAKITVMHAVAPISRTQMSYVGLEAEQIGTHLEHEARNIAAELRTFLDNAGLDSMAHATSIVEGTAARAILERCKALGTELVVMGTSGKGGLSKALLGSVAEEVLRAAECDVLAVPAAAT